MNSCVGVLLSGVPFHGVYLCVFGATVGRVSCLPTLCDLARTDGNLVANFEASLQDSASSDTTFESLSILARLVNIEGTDHDHVGGHSVTFNTDHVSSA